MANILLTNMLMAMANRIGGKRANARFPHHWGRASGSVTVPLG